MPRQCPLHTCQVFKKNIKIKIITQWRVTIASGWGQGCFVENLHIIGLQHLSPRRQITNHTEITN